MPFLPPNQQRQSNEDSGHLSEETELIGTAEVTDADRWAEQQTVLLYMIDTWLYLMREVTSNQSTLLRQGGNKSGEKTW